MGKASHSGSEQQSSPDEINLLLLVRATYISVLFFAHIPFVVNHTFNATPTERLQHYLLTTCPCFDNLEFDKFNAGGLQCHFITSVQRAGKFPNVR